jgi:hypothetical protein
MRTIERRDKMKFAGVCIYVVGMPFWLAGLFFGYAVCVFRGGMETAEILLRRYDDGDRR